MYPLPHCIMLHLNFTNYKYLKKKVKKLSLDLLMQFCERKIKGYKNLRRKPKGNKLVITEMDFLRRRSYWKPMVEHIRNETIRKFIGTEKVVSQKNLFYLINPRSL